MNATTYKSRQFAQLGFSISFLLACIRSAQATTPVPLVSMPSSPTYANSTLITNTASASLVFKIPSIGDYTLNSVSVVLHNDGSGQGNTLFPMLCTDNGGTPTPTGIPFCTGVISNWPGLAVTDSSAAKITFNASPHILVAGVTYWIIISPSFSNNSPSSIVADGISSTPKSTAQNGAVLIAEKLAAPASTNVTDAPLNYSWEVIATPNFTPPTPVSASVSLF